MVGDHALAECLDVRIGRLRLGKLTGVDIDRIGGDHDVRDLRVVRCLRKRTGGCEKQCARDDDACFSHLDLLG